MKSVCRAGRLKLSEDWVWMPLKSPWPKRPPLPRASIPRVCCQPTPLGSKLWSRITRKRLSQYVGSFSNTASRPMPTPREPIARANQYQASPAARAMPM